MLAINTISNNKPAAVTAKTATENLKPRLLLVDDTKVIRASASRILSDEFDVMLATNGEEAWEYLVGDKTIQAVFTDLSMPRLDGYGLLERIRQSDDERLSNLPVIIVTGQEGDEARAEALRRGATDFVTKPFNRIDLTARAKSHATYTQKTRELEAYTTIDPLTRLGNKHLFLEKLGQDRAFTLRHKDTLSLLRLDVINIRDIATKAGKETAAMILKQIASVLRTTIRQEDTAARIGTAQFAAILPACDAEGGERLAERLQRVLRAANERHAAKGLALQVVIAVSTPSEKPDASLDKILAGIESVMSQEAGAGIHILAKPQKKSALRKPEKQSSAPKPLTVEEALALIASGQTRGVIQQLPSLLKRLMPLFRLANEKQRATLKDYLDRNSGGSGK